MKNIFYKLGIVCLFAATFVSCEEDRVVYDVNNGQTAFMFMESASDLPVNNTAVANDTIEVGVTTKSNVERVIPVNIDAASTATAEQYSIQASSLVIPAGEFVGKIILTGNFDALPEVGSTEVILTLDEEQVTVLDDQSFHIVTLFRSCPTEAAGMYSVHTVYGFHDFLADYPENTMEVEVMAQPGLNTYKVKDFSGGLYSVGPYADAYGTGAPAAAASIDLIFTLNCGKVQWTGQADPWGAITATNVTGNTYDPVTGVITISWTAVGYGENGVSVYTPID